jgi:hypothetical protein
MGFSWHIWIDLGLKKGRRWFLNLLGAPSIIHWNTRISCSKCNCELVNKVSCLFLSVPANYRLSILSNDKSGLAYCWCLTKRVGALLQILPANEKLGLEPHEIAQILLTNRMQRNLQDHKTTAERRK